MSKVILFSRRFPKSHPRVGQPTFFVEKLWNSVSVNMNYYELCRLNDGMEENSKPILWEFWKTIKKSHEVTDHKYHTIRSGNRFKVGDKFSPRVWYGLPYRTKQIIIGPDIEIKSVDYIKLDIKQEFVRINWDMYSDKYSGIISNLSFNDGLTFMDFEAWFLNSFEGQIIGWNDKIRY